MNPSTTSHQAHLVKLLEKYSKALPRYTSYPTAPHFHESFATPSWHTALIESSRSSRPLSLYVHIPFCDTLCYFCGCNMIATHRYHRVEPYLQNVRREMETIAAIIGNHRIVQQIHWGGGTPTFLKPEDIARLASWMRELFGQQGRFDLNDQGQETVEMGCEIDPRELTQEHLSALRQAGFNRLSFGVQDLDPKVQLAVNRIEPEDMVRRVYEWSRSLGFSSINLDLMTGLPHQTVESFTKTIDVVMDLAPDRLAVFSYAHLPQMIKHQSLIPESALPPFETRLALQNLVRDRLSLAGYINVGMDHYAKSTDEMVIAQQQKTLWRNFQGYTTHKDCDILAFGVSAISQTENVYCQNQKKINDYEAHITQHGLAAMRGIKLSHDDQLRRDIISRLMCHLSLDIPEFEAQWNINVREYFPQAFELLTPMQDDGLVTLSTLNINVTPLGVPFIRNIVMGFDAYLNSPSTSTMAPENTLTQQPHRPRYSQTI